MTVRAQVTAVLVVLALIGILDFGARVYVPRDEAVRDSQLQPSEPIDAPLSLAEARQRLQSWLPDQGPAAQAGPGSDAPQDGIDTADRSDRGELGGKIFVLRGVFDTVAGPAFAVVEVTPKAGGSTERHEAKAGDTINEVRVERIAGRRVSLSDGDTTIELALFLDPEKDTVGSDEPDD